MSYRNEVADLEAKLAEKDKKLEATIICKNDLEIELTHKEYELLVLLVQNVNNAVTREQLVESVWESTISR